MSKTDKISHSLSPDAPITLFMIDATALGGTIEYGTNCGQDVTFGTQLYTHYSAQFDGFGIREDGRSNSPTVRIVSNPWIKTFVKSYDQGRNATFTRIRTYRRFLADGSDPDPTQTFPPEIYRIERMSSMDESMIEWELSAATDLEGLSFPLRVIIKDHCDYIYRVRNSSNTAWIYGDCPYTGSSMWDKNDQPTGDPRLDDCAGKLTGCRLRFMPAPLPFRGFPGAGDPT